MEWDWSIVELVWNGTGALWSRYGMGLEHCGVGMEWDWSIMELVWNGTGAMWSWYGMGLLEHYGVGMEWGH